MRKRLSSEDFLKLVEELWQPGPKVKYQNPNAWMAFLDLWRKLRNENETTTPQPSCRIVRKQKKNTQI